MKNDESKTDLVRVGNSEISRYSGSLVKRAVADIALKTPEIIKPNIVKKKILITGWEVGEGLSWSLPLEGYDVKFIPYYGGPISSKEIVSELSREKYDLVIVSLWNLWEVLLEIRERFPAVKTIFMNSYKEEWDVIAIQRGVNEVLRVPFDYEELLDRIKSVLGER